jgi:anti-sigma factor RsiW
MCPDRDLISAYIDGEVPSPWRERLEEHIAACSDCAALAASYSALGERLRAPTGAAESAALARGRERLDALLADIPEPAFRQRAVGTDLKRPSSWAAWRRSITLPLPLAAAAALIVILLGGATTMLALKPDKGTPIQAVASGELAPQLAQPASMDELLRYLNSSDGQVTLTINLPTGTTFGSAGKPVIMRSGQVLRGTTVGGSSP